jgi:hypothetical protein
MKVIGRIPGLVPPPYNGVLLGWSLTRTLTGNPKSIANPLSNAMSFGTTVAALFVGGTNPIVLGVGGAAALTGAILEAAGQVTRSTDEAVNAVFAVKIAAVPIAPWLLFAN